MTILEGCLVLAAIGISIGFLLYSLSDIEGCSGDCNQGRRECNCPLKNKK